MNADPGRERAYHLSQRPGAPPRDIYVGWDARRHSYFAQVVGYGDRGEGIEDVDVFSAGYPAARRPATITDPQQLIGMVERYAVIPDALLDHLVADQRYPGRPVLPDEDVSLVRGTGTTLIFLASDPAPQRDRPTDDLLYRLERRTDTDLGDTYVAVLIDVGWDSQLRSYIACVNASTDAFEPSASVDLLRVGDPPQVIADPDQIIRAVQPYAVIPDNLLDRLVADRLYVPPDMDGHVDVLAGRVVVELGADAAPAPAAGASASAVPDLVPPAGTAAIRSALAVADPAPGRTQHSGPELDGRATVDLATGSAAPADTAMTGSAGTAWWWPPSGDTSVTAASAVYHLAAGDNPPWEVYGPPDHPVEVRIGWDATRATFFAQVSKDAVAFVDGQEYPSNAVRIGTAPYEVRTAGQVLDAVRPWAVVPDWLPAELEHVAGPQRDRVAAVHTGNDDLYLGATARAAFLDGSDDDAVTYRVLPPGPAPGPDRTAPAAAAAFRPLRQVHADHHQPTAGAPTAPQSAHHRGPHR